MKTNIAARYSCGLATVDIIPIDYDKRRVLLCRKPKENKFRFFGGFVDPEIDNTILGAAKRELKEEAGDIETPYFELISQPKINDERYLDDKDKIFTSFFACQFIFGCPKPSDDLEGGEVKWFNIEDLTSCQIMPVHHVLLTDLLEYLKKKGLY